MYQKIRKALQCRLDVIRVQGMRGGAGTGSTVWQAGHRRKVALGPSFGNLKLH
jgi:hypothetical protein